MIAKNNFPAIENLYKIQSIYMEFKNHSLIATNCKIALKYHKCHD